MKSDEIVLKADWDIPIRLSMEGDRIEGYFVGRDAEVSHLKSDLQRRNSGAIIVIGHRGVGKTSFVYQAISKARESNKKIVPVLMNATQLQDGDEKEAPLRTIENLIRRLYATIGHYSLDAAVKKELDKLYKKAQAHSARITEAVRSAETDERSQVTETQFTISPEGLAYAGVVLVVATAGGALISRAPFLAAMPVVKEIARGFVSLGLPAVFLGKFLLQKRRSKISLRESSADEVYETDKTLGNLEHDLERVHQLIARQKYKIIYVVDELDKLEVAQAKKVLQHFKNLFTLSDAQFIFIGSERFSGLSDSKADAGELRSKEYTLFSSKYFIMRPRYSDVSQYLDMVVDGKKAPADVWERFKRSICFEARNDFFDLKDKIRDRIKSHGENGCPAIGMADWDGADQRRQQIHRAVTILIEGKYLSDSPSLWEQNEKLQRLIFDRAHEVFRAFPGGSAWNDPETDDAAAQLTRDFHTLLERHGALAIGQTRQVSQKGKNIQVRNYTYKGPIVAAIPDSLNELTEFEKQFVEVFEKYCDAVRRVLNAQRKLQGQNEIAQPEMLASPQVYIAELKNQFQLDGSGIINPYLGHYQQLRSKGPHPGFQLDQVQTWTGEVAKGIKQIQTSTPHILCEMVKREKGLASQVQNISQNQNLFAGAATPMRAVLSKIGCNIIYVPDLSRQVAVPFGNAALIDGLKKSLRENAATHRIVLFNDTDASSNGMTGVHVVKVSAVESLDMELAEGVGQVRKFFAEQE